MSAPPGDRGQLDFLRHVQRIFDEGEFVATYKFALLIASRQSPGGAMKQDPHVDHFIPWSRYPRDLARNFVLAHGGSQCEP